MEADAFAHALEHRALQVVVEETADPTAEEAEGLDVAGQEAREARVVEEAHEEHAGERQHHHEGEEPPVAAPHLAPAEVGPVHLGLLARKGAQQEERLRRLPRPQAELCHAVTEVVPRARIPPPPGHLVELARRQLRVAREHLAQPGHVGVQGRRVPLRRGLDRLHGPAAGQSPAHRAVVHAQVPRDRPPAPALNRGQTPDLGRQLRRDHGRPCPAGGDDARSRAGRTAGRGGDTTSSARGRSGGEGREARRMGRSAAFRMPPRCQSPSAVGYPDASLFSTPGHGTGDRKPAGPREGAGLAASAGSAGPPPGSSAAAPPAGTPDRSSAAPGRTTSTGRPPSDTGRTRTADSRDAEPAPLGLDSGVKTGDDLLAGSTSSRPLRRMGVFSQTSTRPPHVGPPPFSPTPRPARPTPHARSRDDDDAGCLKGFTRATARIPRFLRAAHTPGPAPEATEENAVQATVRVASPDYLTTLRLPLLEGRPITPADRKGSKPVALINQRLAEAKDGNTFTVGEGLRIAGLSDEPWEIVGVVASARQTGFDQDSEPEIYVPYAQYPIGRMELSIRGDDPRALATPVRETLRSLDSRQLVEDVQTLEELIYGSTSRGRFYATLLALFAALSLVLVVSGIFGALGYWVRSRSREIGVRLALGATPTRLTTTLVGEGVLIVSAGLAAGLLAALSLTRYLTSELCGVTPTSPAVYATVAALVLTAGTLAVLLPVRRYCSVDARSVLSTL
jgi:hypothetical protein